VKINHPPTTPRYNMVATTRSKSRRKTHPSSKPSKQTKTKKVKQPPFATTPYQKIAILSLFFSTVSAVWYLGHTSSNEQSPEPILLVLAYGWITAVSTGLGVVPFLFTTQQLSQRWLGAANAIAAGMMLTASGTLAFEGFHAENDQDRLYWGLSCAQRMSGGFLLGIAFIILIKWLLDADDIGVGELQGADAKRALLVMAVMTLHSFAEGVGIGVAFSGEEEGHELGTFIALSLAIHNVPEGLAVAVVLIPRGVSLISTAGWSIFSSLPQPLVAIPVFLFVSAAIPWLPVGLGFASGAMLYVALFELLPEASHLINAPTTVTLTVVSSAVMVVLQNAARVPVA
jgi:zinc transporter ZupT